MSNQVNRNTEALLSNLPQGMHLAIIGSTSFWHADSEKICQALGSALAKLPDAVLLTGGVSGIGEACGRSFYQRRLDLQLPQQVFHVLPHGMAAWDYGQTLYAGQDMSERRAVLARMVSVYIVIEGGPATADEVRIALENGAVVIPLARSGACARDAYTQINKPAQVSSDVWAVLGNDAATIDETLSATMEIIACLFSTRKRH